jgi:opacity protein-like surface antigen
MLAGLVALVLALVMALPVGGPALANGRGRGVPAPIPVPAPVPVPEGFTYYLRGDLGWAFAGGAPSFSESGAEYGTTPLTFADLSGRSTGIDDVFFGGIGAGVYLTPHFRADVTIDFRGQQDIQATATYVDGATSGTVRDTVSLRGTIGLLNGYWDLRQRGGFTPYVGAGIGFVYNDIQRDYLDANTGPDVTGSSSDNHLGLAAALMAGFTFAVDHRFAWDLGYRALYTDGGSITTTLSDGDESTARVGSHWEHQIRIGVRANIW